MKKIIFLGLFILMFSSFVSADETYYAKSASETGQLGASDGTVKFNINSEGNGDYQIKGIEFTSASSSSQDYTVSIKNTAETVTYYTESQTGMTIGACTSFPASCIDFDFSSTLADLEHDTDYHIVITKTDSDGNGLLYSTDTFSIDTDSPLGLSTMTASKITSVNAPAKAYISINDESTSGEIFNIITTSIYDNSTINTYQSYFINDSGTTNINTTNGTVFGLYNDLVNLSIYANDYHSRTYYNYNTTVNLEVDLYQHNLYYPENGYILNNSETLSFQYNISDDTDLNSCQLYINDTQKNTTSSLNIGINTLKYTFIDNGAYEWFIKCNNVESPTRRLMVTNVTGPTIVTTSPSQNINVTEGDTKEFSIGVSSPLKYIVEWFKDSVSQAYGVVWSWIVGDNEQGDNKNITAIVTDSFGQKDSFEWNVNITNLNLAPTVSSISVSLDTIYENVDYYVSCNLIDSDTNEDDLIVDIQWAKGSIWYDLTEYYIDSEWRGNISSFTHSTGESISYRCRGTDNETPALISDWYYVNNFREIGVAQSPPQTPEILKPDYGIRKYTIPIMCAGAYDGQADTQDIYYEVSTRKNSSSWELIRNQSEIVLYSYPIGNDGYNTTYDFRCRAYDGIEYSDYNTVINGTIKRDIPVFSIIKTMDNPTYINGRVYNQGYFIDMSALGPDYSIHKVTAECNNDGLIDYVKDHNYNSIIKGSFNCINKGGTIKHSIDAYVFKNNTNSNWKGICTGLDKTNQYCRLTKEYEVYINE